MSIHSPNSRWLAPVTPQLAQGTPEEIERRLQRSTGQELLPSGELRTMKIDAWFKLQDE
ncbi:MAG: hypothetical protein RIC55_14815 [Pirellulaceae bacterium]